MNGLLTEYQNLLQEVRRRGIYYDPQGPPNLTEVEARPQNYRQNHTRGNTKNQRRNIKRQQSRVLESMIIYLRGLLEENTTPKILDDFSAGSDSSGNSSSGDDDL